MNDDLISRVAAIEALERIMSDYPLDGYEDEWLLINALKDLPPAQPERKKGKWVQDDIASNVFRCSECGCDAPVDPTAGCEIKSNFCQWCGTDMRGEQDG